MNQVFDHSSSQVDEFLQIPEAERRTDLYRSQETIPAQHPNGYQGPGTNLRDSHLQEGYTPTRQPDSKFIPGASPEGSIYMRRRRENPMRIEPSNGSALEAPLAIPNALSTPDPAYDSGAFDSSSRRTYRPAEPGGVVPASYSLQWNGGRPRQGQPAGYGEQLPAQRFSPRHSTVRRLQRPNESQR